MQFDQFIEDFSLGVYRNSKLILDNAGILIRQESLDDYPDYAIARIALFGGSRWLSRLWCTKLRPVLRPQEQAIILAEFERQRKNLQRDYMLAVLEKGIGIARESRQNADC